MNKFTQPAHILLVEDNPADARLTMEGLNGNGDLRIRISVAQDGLEALAFVKRKGKYATAPRPDLIVLDLNLPKKHGLEVLAEIKSDPGLKRIPVVVLTTSEAGEDVARTYELHANCFVTKPFELDRFIAVLHLIRDFWLSAVNLPPAE